MAYASLADLQSRFSESELIDLSDREQTGAINLDVIDQALADASAEIDGYLGGRYSLPLPSVPDVLTRLCCDIARYLLYSERAPEQLQKRYDNAVGFLKALSKGDISLGLPDSQQPDPSANTAQITSAGTMFNREDSSGWL